MMIGMGLGMVDRDIEVGKEYKVGTFTLNGVTYDRYVKIVDCGALPSTTTGTMVNSRTNLGEDFNGVLNISGILNGNMSANTPIQMIPYAHPTIINYQITAMIAPSSSATQTKGDIFVYAAFDYSNRGNVFVTVEYYR